MSIGRTAQRLPRVAHLIAFACILTLGSPAAAASASRPQGSDAIDIVVDTVVILVDDEAPRVGINLNYLMDDTFLQPPPDTAASLRQLATRPLLRYPGGEKSDGYLWDTAPYPTSPGDSLTPQFARQGPWAWPANDPDFAQADQATPRSLTLDFREFLNLCAQVECEPIVVVPYDAMFAPVTAGASAPTREQLLANAVEMVRYANVTLGRGVGTWMIGNETWNTNSYNGSTDAATYAQDLSAFSRAMKAVDPGIRIAANGNSAAWWQTVLGIAAADIDALAVSEYPAAGLGSYDAYLAAVPDLTPRLDEAMASIAAYAPPEHRDRLQVLIAEASMIDWLAGPGATAFTPDGPATMGHALATFELFGQALERRPMSGVMFWNTRWVDNAANAKPSNYDAFGPDGRLHASAQALSLWGWHVLPRMVSASEAPAVRAFATHDRRDGRLNVFAINTTREAQLLRLEVRGYASHATTEARSLAGVDEADTAPAWSMTTTLPVQGASASPRVAHTLPPVSITHFSFTAPLPATPSPDPTPTPTPGATGVAPALFLPMLPDQ